MSQQPLIPATPTARPAARRTTATPHPGQHLEGPISSWRDAKTTWCPSCKAPVIRGPNDSMCAFTVAVDLTPLDVVGEAIAWLTGRRTHTLQVGAGRPTLTRRNRWTIPAMPPGGGKWDVLAEHHCNAGQLPTMTTTFPAPAEMETLTDECPY